MRRIRVKTIVNEREVKRLQERDAAGMAAMGQAVLDTANVPVLTGRLRESGAYVVMRSGRRYAGEAEMPRETGDGKGAKLAVGYDMPGRFHEAGTIKMPARPFVTPAMDAVLPRKEQYLRAAHRRR